jgi:hypothetical protein
MSSDECKQIDSEEEKTESSELEVMAMADWGFDSHRFAASSSIATLDSFCDCVRFSRLCSSASRTEFFHSLKLQN